MNGWSFDPAVVGGLLLVSFLYARGVVAVWRRSRVGALVGRGRVVAFTAGIYVLAIALLSPLDDAAHVLFSAHMVQHMLLMVVVAPLLVAGAPLLPMLWGLPRGGRLWVGRAWNARPWLGRVWHALTGPMVVWLVLTATLWIWHLPGPYQAAVLRPSFHVLEHATMLGASLLFWWVVLQPIGSRRIDGGTAVLLVFATKVQSATLGALITFLPRPLYPVYEASAVTWGMSPMQDQHLAGLIMGTGSGLAFLAAGAWLFITWLATIERRQRPPGAGAAATTLRVPRLESGA